MSESVPVSEGNVISVGGEVGNDIIDVDTPDVFSGDEVGQKSDLNTSPWNHVLHTHRGLVDDNRVLRKSDVDNTRASVDLTETELFFLVGCVFPWPTFKEGVRSLFLSEILSPAFVPTTAENMEA